MYPASTLNLRPASPKLSTIAKPLQIGFFTDMYVPQVNGVAVALQLVVDGLRAAGHRVTVFAPRFPGYRDLETGIYRLPAVRYMRMPPVYLAVPGTPRTALALRRSQFDVLHVHTPLTLGFLAYLTASAKRVPLIYTYHTSITDYTHYLRIGGKTRPVRWAARWFSTTTCNLCDQIVTPSAKFERLLRAQKVKRPIHVIPNGIDLRRFYEAQPTGAYRRRLGLNPETPLLLYVGRLAPEKSLDLLLDAFAHLAARRPDVHLALAGDGNSRRALEKQAAASGYADRIHFLGMVNRADLPDLLHEANLFLSTSTSETQGVAMVEAIASGLPVVAVWDEAFEDILVDGVNGRIAPREAGAFSRTVADLLADSAARQTFSRNSVELSRKFSIEAEIESLVKLYTEAAAREREGSPST